MRVSRRLVALVAAAAAVFALGVTVPASAEPEVDADAASVPHFDHIVVLTLENESAGTTFAPGSPATYLNGLRAQGVFVPNYYGTSHVSLPNYIAMVSGQLANGVTNTDCSTVSLWLCAQTTKLSTQGRHLGDQLDAAGLSWKAYMDGAPTPCFHGPYSTSLTDLITPDPYQGNSQTPPAKDYADRHNPFVYFPNLVGNPTRCAAHERPFTELSGDISSNALPAFSFITPDTCHDGHDATCSDGSVGGLTGADQWLSANLPPLLTYLQSHNGVLIINFDEDGIVPTSTNLADYVCLTCASLGLGGRTGAVVVGAGLTAGKTVTKSYDHYSLLRTIEDSFGFTERPLNMARIAKPMVDVLTP